MISASSTAPLPKEGLGSNFYLVWLGQFVSSFGTMLSTFALGVWLFQRTGSVLDFSTMIAFSTLPAVVLLPFSGGFADRHNKQRILIACDCVAALCAATIGLLVWQDLFLPWHLYAVQFVLSVSIAFQGPAAYVTITRLVPKSQLGRASGMFALSGAISQLAAPLVAAALLASVDLEGIVVIDLLSFAAALAGLVLARFPATLLASAPTAPRRALFHDFEVAIGFFERHPVLAIVFGYMSMGGFLMGCVIVLVTPMVLAAHDQAALALISSSGALGATIGGMLIVGTGGPRQWQPALLALNLSAGIALMVAGYTSSVTVLCVCAFVVMFSTTTLSACVQGVWRRKVPRDCQGSIVALQQAVALALIPLSAIVGGTVSHFLFEPALMPDGIWADTIGPWFGIGSGRGTGFFFLVIGMLASCAALVSLATRRVYRLETEVPDAP